MHVREGEVVGEHPPEKILGAEEGPEEVETETRNVKWRSQTSTIKTLHTSSDSSISSGPSIMSFLCLLRYSL